MYIKNYSKTSAKQCREHMLWHRIAPSKLIISKNIKWHVRVWPMWSTWQSHTYCFISQVKAMSRALRVCDFILCAEKCFTWRLVCGNICSVRLQHTMPLSGGRHCRSQTELLCGIFVQPKRHHTQIVQIRHVRVPLSRRNGAPYGNNSC